MKKTLITYLRKYFTLIEQEHMDKYGQVELVSDGREEGGYYSALSVAEEFITLDDSVIADIRNKLSPITNLVALIETGADIEYIKKQLPQVKVSIEYLTTLED